MSDLGTYLQTAFRLLEPIFGKIDLDGTMKITFSQLMRFLTTYGFRDDEKMHQVFARVDKHGDGALDFGEFLVLMYLWAEVGNYTQIIRDPGQADVVKNAFEVMEKCYVGYDQDKSRQLSRDEFQAFMQQQLPAFYAHEQSMISELFTTDTLSFSRFLFVVYRVVVPQPRFNIPVEHRVTSGGGLWNELTRCFAGMERDFALFDTDQSNTIDLKELTEGVSIHRPATERLDVLTRMEYFFRMVDVDRTEAIDFFEFLYLAFLITQQGSYRDLVHNATSPADVKACFTTLRNAYRKYDADHSNRLELNEVQAFMNGEFGVIPAGTDDAFMRLRSSPDRPHIDFVRFLRLLYMVVNPQGRFNHAAPQKPAAAPQRPHLQGLALPPGGHPKHPRFDNIDVSQVKKGKILGQGGQGMVCEAEYQGIRCGFKTLLEGATPETCAETRDEAQLMWRMDHPNVHYLHGFVAEMPNVCLLTELCESGSMFDCYMKKRMRFDRPTQWRFAHECALGINVLHHMNPPFMHRDLKSLNIFLDAHLVCKVADFGMAKDPKDGPNYQGMGTPQWCAPEVLSSTNYDERADIFSYAIMLWEITHMQVPYCDSGMNQSQISRAVITQDIRPRIAPETPPGFAALMRACWERDPARRPRLDDVLRTLDTLKPEFGVQ